MTSNQVTKCLLLTVWIVGLFSIKSTAQTCSCAGAPLLGAQSSAPVFGGDLFIGISHEYHDISRLYVNGDLVENESTFRTTQSTLMEVHYGLSAKLSISGTLTHVRKYRQTGLHTQNPQSLTVSGVGDGLVMLKYKLFDRRKPPSLQATIGSGLKVPLGSFDVRNNGFLLNADMQPGTGAWDSIVWSELTSSFDSSFPLNLFLIASYRSTGSSERFGTNDIYQFGNELITTAGGSTSLGEKIGYTAVLQYRSASSDKRNEVQQPNTGGFWISHISKISYSINDRYSVQIDGRIPLMQELNGLQPTTSYAVTFSFFVNLSKRLNRIY